MLNMGLCGWLGLAYLLAIGADLNGPTIGGIMTIVGFAAFGQHLLNSVPVTAGIFFGSLAKPWAINDPAIVQATLFGTSLAPIAGQVSSVGDGDWWLVFCIRLQHSPLASTMPDSICITMISQLGLSRLSWFRSFGRSRIET
jgi:hypothetical protein